MIQKPRTLSVARAVGWVTFQEILRDRVLYNVLMCCFLLFGVSFLASRLTFIRPDRVLLDFGLSGVMLSCALLAILSGASLLAREFDRRTIYVALCHPISRGQFLLGKFLGLAAIVSLNWVFMAGAYLLMLQVLSDGQSVFSSTLFAALFLIWVQSLVLSSLAIFFSTFTTTSLAVVFSIGLYLVGNTISQLHAFAARLESPLSRYALKGLTFLLPNLETFNLGLKVTYGLPVSAVWLGTSVLYGIFVIALLLVLASLLIQGREV